MAAIYRKEKVVRKRVFRLLFASRFEHHVIKRMVLEKVASREKKF